jgi:hypothetical protein
LGQLRGQLGEAVLDRLERPDRAAELAPLLRVGERVVERALGEAERRRRKDRALVVEP